ncbi:putative glucuronosyltransferase [Platanthera zijinensis]|uniref:Glycosyltransferases n=1 Tax=Platanthera zijinensis TaxID=2320716 RepID=A0AAP0BIH4_9ASPA
MGFFTGFAPSSTTVSPLSVGQHHSTDIRIIKISEVENKNNRWEPAPTMNSSVSENDEGDGEFGIRQQLIIITTADSHDPLQEAFLWRLGQTLRLVPLPLLWIIVEAYANAPETEKRLRGSGVMYRHITYKGNFTAADTVYHQRNIALNHVEHHRLNGIVHFAGAFNIYTVQFFEEIRRVQVFGTWPVAMVSASRKRIVIEGPICSSSRVIGWQSKELGGANVLSREPVSSTKSGDGKEDGGAPARINISGFSFNSTILWDPERWGRPSSIPDSSQDSIRFVHQFAREDETKIRAIPADCSRVMMWHLHILRPITF